MHEQTCWSHPGADTLVVCIHGFMGSPRQMDVLAKAAHSRGHDALSLLLPGHGGSGRDFAAATAEGWQAHVTDTVMARRSRYRRIFLVGHSMGGLLALGTASQIPVQGLLLIACPLRLRGPGLVPAGVRLRQLIYPKRHPMKAAYLRGSSVPLSLALLWRSRGPSSQLKGLITATAAVLANVRAPVIAVYSRGDEVVSPASWDILRQGLSGAAAEHILLRTSCHAYYPPAEQQQITQALLSLLDTP